jgi:hypothetical protein
MQVTRANYTEILPEILWEAYLRLANSRRAEITPIIYINRELRFANADEL